MEMYDVDGISIVIPNNRVGAIRLEPKNELGRKKLKMLEELSVNNDLIISRHPSGPFLIIELDKIENSQIEELIGFIKSIKVF